MNKAPLYALVVLIIAAATHFGVVYLWPRVLMNAAITRLSDRGTHFNAWRVAPRVDENARGIVRPSPDLQYSACPYDLEHGPLRIHVNGWDNYWSLSLYADNSDNYFVIDDREAREGADITLIRAGQPPPEDAGRTAESPSQRGIALIRRLAPTSDRYDAAAHAAQGDVCAAFTAQ